MIFTSLGGFITVGTWLWLGPTNFPVRLLSRGNPSQNQLLYLKTNGCRGVQRTVIPIWRKGLGIIDWRERTSERGKKWRICPYFGGRRILANSLESLGIPAKCALMIEFRR